MNDILSLTDLRAKFNVKSEKKLKAWLTEKGIRWEYDPDHKPFTTIHQVDKVLDGKNGENEVDF